jgi:hypothetical protein
VWKRDLENTIVKATQKLARWQRQHQNPERIIPNVELQIVSKGDSHLLH